MTHHLRHTTLLGLACLLLAACEDKPKPPKPVVGAAAPSSPSAPAAHVPGARLTPPAGRLTPA